MTDLKELQKAIEKADKILRPYAIICNPKYQKKIKDNFEHRFIVYASDFVPSEQVYVVNRKQFEALKEGEEK